MKKFKMNLQMHASFDMEDVDKYGSSGSGGFFSLPNDKDVAKVRFMYHTKDDVKGYAVHEIEVEGKKRYVGCLRKYNEPVDNCPLCQAKSRVIAKLFVMLYDIESQEVKIWDRGKTFFSKMQSLTSRYNPLVATTFEIERNGKKGDTGTTYETFPLEVNDGTTLEDLPEIPEIMGSLVLAKSYDEIVEFINTGEFPEEGVVGRNPEADQQPNQPQRRTPSQRNVSSTDKF